MDIHTIINCELLLLSKLSAYNFISQVLVINFPADPAGYARTMQSILVSYSFIMFLREYEAQNLGGGQLTVLERIKGHGVRLAFNFWAYLVEHVVYAVLGFFGGFTLEDATVASCSSWRNTPIHLHSWNTMTTFHHTIEILTLVRLGHVFLLLMYNIAQYVVQKIPR